MSHNQMVVLDALEGLTEKCCVSSFFFLNLEITFLEEDQISQGGPRGQGLFPWSLSIGRLHEPLECRLLKLFTRRLFLSWDLLFSYPLKGYCL